MAACSRWLLGRGNRGGGLVGVNVAVVDAWRVVGGEVTSNQGLQGRQREAGAVRWPGQASREEGTSDHMCLHTRNRGSVHTVQLLTSPVLSSSLTPHLPYLPHLPPPPLRHFHLNQLVRVDGVVTRRTGVYPQLQRTFFDCLKCAAVLGPYFQTGDREIKLGSCPSCQSKGPFQASTQRRVAGGLLYVRVLLCCVCAALCCTVSMCVCAVLLRLCRAGQ